MISIKIKDKDWEALNTLKKSDIVSSKTYGWCGGQFRYSPNGRYAAFNLDAYKNRKIIFYIADLFTKEFTIYMPTCDRLDEEKTLFFYWINDSEIMTYLDYGSELRQLRYEVDHLNRELHKVAENVEHVNFLFCPHTRNGALRFSFRNQEYLLIPSGSHRICLLPYVINLDNRNQPTMITVTFWRIMMVTEEYIAIIPNSFGYKDKLFCFMDCAVLKRQIFDKFLCFDLTQKEVIDGNINIEEQDSVIFEPKQIGPGSFWSEKCMTAWQEGPQVVITEHQPTDKKRTRADRGDRFWILDLEKETIKETLVETKRLSRATLYQEDSLLLWSFPKYGKKDLTKLKCRQILRTDIVPRLKSICTAKLLSQKGIEKNEVAERFLYQ